MKTSENKTKDYILRATKTYQDKHDRIVVLAAPGTKDRIKATGAASVNAFVNDVITKALDDIEKQNGITGGGSPGSIV